MADTGLIITLPGYDVDKATPEQCAIHTKYNSPKIDATKEHFVTFRVFFATEPPDASVGSSLETILHPLPHTFDYVPQLWLHCDYTSRYGSTSTPQFGPGEAYLRSTGLGDDAYIGVRADRDNCYVYIRKHRATSVVDVLGMTVNLRLYIFAETAYE